MGWGLLFQQLDPETPTRVERGGVHLIFPLPASGQIKLQTLSPCWLLVGRDQRGGLCAFLLPQAQRDRGSSSPSPRPYPGQHLAI